MTMITAHGGAGGTGRNSAEYFSAVESGGIVCDAVEVDIWGKPGCLYLSHAPSLFKRRKIKLEYAFELAKQLNLKINCDIKKPSLFLPVLNAAKKCGVTQHVYFTGATKPRHVKFLDECEIYANESFYKRHANRRDPQAIKAYIDSFKNPRLRGININYKRVTHGFILRCVKLGLGVSVYFADTLPAIQFLMQAGVQNITTDAPQFAQ